MPDDGDWIREDDEWFRPEEDDAPAAASVDEEPDDGDYDDGGPGRSAMVWALAAVLVLIIGLGSVAAVALLAGDDDKDGESASDLDTGSSTTSTSTRDLGVPGQLGSSTTVASSSTSSTVGVGGSGGGTGGSSATSTTKKPTTTTSSTVKEATNDPDCSKQGTSDPSADAYPVKVSFCVDDAHPKVGQAVTVTGVARDDDSQVEPGCIKVTFDDEVVTECQPVANPSNPIANREFAVTHFFTTPGDHTIHAAAASDPPKGGVAATSYKITVHA
jgi:cytoskeletal protein RodZ